MDVSQLPHAQYIPGRQAAIDHAARIDKEPFLIVNGILFGSAVLSVAARLGIRIFGRRNIGWDDGLVLFATMALIVAFSVCLRLLNTLYLVEAMNKKAAVPFQEEIPDILDLSKWATVFAAMNWTAVYMVKFAFMNFFHVLIKGMSPRITRFYWATVGISIICWLYTILGPIIICPHFGASSAKCSANPHQHVRSLANNLIIAIIDIVTDSLIVALPVVILRQSMIPFTRKLSLAAILCLSTAMIICALARLVGTIIDTQPDGSGSAPVWSTFWAMVEGCVSLIMTAVIAIRSVFVSQIIHDDRQKQASIMQRFGRRLLSTLRPSGSSRNLPRLTEDERDDGSGTPRVITQGETRTTMGGVRRFISGDRTKKDNGEIMLKSLDGNRR
ncbi:hypothetical protein Hte_011452 [Hypoxylon texense]